VLLRCWGYITLLSRRLQLKAKKNVLELSLFFSPQMLLGIAGSLCSGKATVVKLLCRYQNFSAIRLINELDDVQSGDDELSMSFDGLMDFILCDGRWSKNYVVWPIESEVQLEVLKKRPFFLLLSVEARTMIRYRRHLSRDETALTLPEFVQLDDERTFATYIHADAILQNDYSSEEDLLKSLESIDPPLTSPHRLRPSWDDYFMLLADLASHRSNCMKRRVGCILARHGRVIATGYNGTPRGVLNCNEGGCARCNDGQAKCGQDLTECLCLHAEENALLEAGRDRIDRWGPDNWTTLYCNTCPCLSCAKKIVQSGVKEVVYRLEYGMDAKTNDLFQKAGIHLRQHRPLLSLSLAADFLNTPSPVNKEYIH
jgi:dCMP deaminase